MLLNIKLVERCRQDTKFIKRVPIIVRKALGIPYEDYRFLPIRKANTPWKVCKKHMMHDKARAIKHYIDDGTALVPLRVDDNGDYFIKLADSRTDVEFTSRQWIEIKLLTSHDGEPLRSKPTSPVLSSKSSALQIHTPSETRER